MNGFYNILKPIGWSSNDLVIKIRGILRRKTGQKQKVGHLGTLDPLATGVLGVAVGSATRLFDHFLSKTKVYVATCVLGEETDTLDRVGKVVERREVGRIDDAEILAALSSFVGTIEQIPPRYSAKSVDGVRAYRLAIKGVDPALKPCTVTIHSIEYLGRDSQNVFKFRVTCSGGTYIRSLCRDIGQALGYPAYMGSLVRERNGTMCLDDAVTLEDVESDISRGFTDLESFSASLQCADYSEDFRKKIENGVRVDTTAEDGLVRVSIDGVFYGIGQITDHKIRILARDV